MMKVLAFVAPVAAIQMDGDIAVESELMSVLDTDVSCPKSLPTSTATDAEQNLLVGTLLAQMRCQSPTPLPGVDDPPLPFKCGTANPPSGPEVGFAAKAAIGQWNVAVGAATLSAQMASCKYPTGDNSVGNLFYTRSLEVQNKLNQLNEKFYKEGDIKNKDVVTKQNNYNMAMNSMYCAYCVDAPTDNVVEFDLFTVQDKDGNPTTPTKHTCKDKAYLKDYCLVEGVSNYGAKDKECCPS